MKKVMAVTVLVLFVLVFASPVLAQEPDDDTGSLHAESPANPLAFLEAWFTDMPRCDGWGNWLSQEGQTVFRFEGVWKLTTAAYGFQLDETVAKVVLNHGTCWTEVSMNRLHTPLWVVFSAEGGMLHGGLGDTGFTWDQVFLISSEDSIAVVVDTDGDPNNRAVTAYLPNYGFNGMEQVLIDYAQGDMPNACVCFQGEDTTPVAGVCTFWIINHSFRF